jgi:hypothetical protein
VNRHTGLLEDIESDVVNPFDTVLREDFSPVPDGN